MSRTTKEKPIVNKLDEQEVSEQSQERESRINAQSPSVIDWVKQIPDLASIQGLYKWVHICKHYKIDTKGASARLVLQNWVKRNKPNWPPVPNT